MSATLMHHALLDEGTDPRILETPGGFAWWYADLVNDEGDGLVLIWSFGLPFLPGLRDCTEPPRAWPALNVALYRRGRPAWYQLQRFRPEDVGHAPEQGFWRFGRTTIARQIHDGEVQLKIELDCRTPAGHLQGEVSMTGPRAVPAAAEGAPAKAAAIDWAVMTACAHSEVDLVVDGAPVRWSGRGYHDRNSGSRPLWDLGVRRWWWGRFPFAGEERIYFVLEPEAEAAAPQIIGVTCDRQGALETTPLTIDRCDDPSSRWGLPVPKRLVLRTPDGRLFTDLRERARPESSPFYARTLMEAFDEDGARTLGVAETVAPHRLDQRWLRPLVRMRVQEPTSASSMLPLFTGAGAFSRLTAGSSTL